MKNLVYEKINYQFEGYTKKGYNRKNMNLLFRTDMNNVIATGHVMRCVSIALEAKKMNCNVLFAIADNNAIGLLEKNNLNYVVLNSEWDNLESEIDKIKFIIGEYGADCIILDSYYVTQTYMQELRSQCKLAYIDDVNAFIYPCDALICYVNYYKKFEYEEKYSFDTKLMLGCKYAPINERFVNISRREKGCFVKEILIMSGGSDNYHFVKNILRKLKNDEFISKDIHFTAICGVYNVDYNLLKDEYYDNKQIEIKKSVDDIENYMNRADIAISASGGTLYELCMLAVPTICYTLADNQLDNAQIFSQEGIMKYAGDLREMETIDNTFEILKKLIFDEDKRRYLSREMRKVVDGKGTSRIVNSLKKLVSEEY